MQSNINNTLRQVSNIADSIAANGAHNLNTFPYIDNSKVLNGITWTLNSDGSVTASGIADDTSTFDMHSRLPEFGSPCILKQGQYIVTGGISLEVGINIDQRDKTPGGYTHLGTDTGSGVCVTIDRDNEFNDSARIGFYMYVMKGQNLTTPVTFYPMIRLASDQSTIFSPYVKTNQQLTSAIDDLHIQNSIATNSNDPLTQSAP